MSRPAAALGRRGVVPWGRVTALAAVIVATLAACGGSDAERGWPSVEVESLASGAPVSTGALVGEVPVVVSLWAVWCQPCKRELPELQELARERAGQVDVVGVNIGDDADQVRVFLDDLGVEFPMYRDVDGLLLAGLDVPQVPATAVVLPSGEVAWLHLGEVTRDEVESAVDEAMAAAAG